MPWRVVIASPFKRGYRRLASWLKEKADNAIRELVNAKNPLALGELKKGYLDGCYGYDLSKRCRILYTCDEQKMKYIFYAYVLMRKFTGRR